MNSSTQLSEHIAAALAKGGACEVHREMLQVLWMDEKCHPDEQLLRIHKLASACDAKVIGAAGAAHVTFVPLQLSAESAHD